MKYEPIRLRGISKSAIWGGTTLRDVWGKPDPGEGVAEAWELTVRPSENSLIVGGDFDGRTLAEWLSEAGSRAIGRDWTGETFPLLIKFIDAREALSVQVHPDDAYASAYEQARGGTGKTEMWYIVDAAEGSALVYGLADSVTPEAFFEAAEQGKSESCLRVVPVHAGESYFIPSGQVHAIGGGILIAEIQQNSDLTYRIYDYGRVSADGRPRELHLEQARAVIRAIGEDEVNALRYARGGKDDPEILANSEYFKVRRFVLEDVPRNETVTEKSFVSLLCVSGN
ncbi:MAG: class I mannose-6-phosphate isomerase, partial [Clostridia bacterium]|nr:class I mannose-6-phosphate isomerase [Clostridia bacterium]